MGKIINYLTDENKWNQYYNFLQEKKQFKKDEIDSVKKILDDKKYVFFTFDYILELIDRSYLMVNRVPKFNSKEKRIVFTTNDTLDIILKFLTFCLRDYDYLYSDNVYSYRHSNSIQDAISKIKNNLHEDTYTLKLDLHSYFNSMDKAKLIRCIEYFFNETDSDFVKFNEHLLYIKTNEEIHSGGLPGLAISCFYANIYLKELDDIIASKGFTYCRYSDDLLIMGKKDELHTFEQFLYDYISSVGLTVNEDKRHMYTPNETIEFLGFNINSSTDVDISDSAFRKIKAKIHRSSKHLKEQISQGYITRDEAIQRLINKYNKKFFSLAYGEVNWSLWYFPVISNTTTLKKIDNYFQDEVRALYTLHYNKKNKEKVPYSLLKQYGYRTLVNAYYSPKNKEKKCS